ncbi:alpha/beta fold hydrolase [Flavobacterium sp. 245]|uniref:alpha/beta fold hydrolase n=1 Tax=Flavobacterium sp. 245 TaxID=2512115 RepID=UPI001FB68E1C|nr:alpha/beta hydrolase [Flavobacterium sp. 245]
MYLSDKKTIMFITGAFISHSCWDAWIVFFENKGYKTVAPPWPYKNASAEILRREHPESKIATVSLENLLDYYIEIIEKLPEKPILIGHSYGGLLMQLLMEKELVYAGVCINSFPPKNGMTLSFSFYNAILKPLGFLTSSKKTYLMSFKDWQQYFTNKMSFEEQKDTYEKLIIPESKILIRNIFSGSAKINFKKKHNPLLFLSSTADHFTPSSIQYSNFKKYHNLHSITCFKEFENQNHYALGQQNWEDIALYIADWFEKIT